METALEAADAGNVLVIGADVARQCLDAGLVDEILLHVAPVLLREGVSLFAGDRDDRGDGGRIQLETVGVTQLGPLANLHYRVSH